MASGLPVVCADAAGSRSLVDDGTTGILCPPRDRGAFEAAVRRLVSDPALRVRMGQAARNAAGDYDWPSVLATMESYYHHVVEAPRATAR